MTFLMITGAIGLIVGGWFALRFKRRHKAAANVLFAKYTWLRLEPARQLEIHQKAITLAMQNGGGTQGFANEVEQFGWYALVMAEEGMPSAVPENPVWYRVKNPYRAVQPHDPLIAAISGALKDQFNTNVTVNPSARFKVPGASQNPAID